MHGIGNALWVLASLLLLAMALPARPARAESFVGAHLVTGPLALALTLAGVLHHAASPPAGPWANGLLALAWPGIALALTMLPLSAHGPGRALPAKVACVLAVAALGLFGNGTMLGAPWRRAGEVGVVLLGLLGWSPVLAWCWQRARRTLAAKLPGAREPSAFEQSQAAWQRQQWAAVPADAGVAALLGFVRAFAPEVRSACLQRLAARADLDAEVAELLRAEDPGDAPHFVVHHYPRSRAALAPATAALLDAQLAVWRRRRAAGGAPGLAHGTVAGMLECGLAVRADGGDVDAALQAWLGELRELAPWRGVARELAGHLRRRPARAPG